MYIIKIKNGELEETLHELDTSSVRRVASCTFTDDLYSVASAEFVVYPANPCYNNLHEMTTLVKIINTLTGKAEFDGHIYQIPNKEMADSGMIAKKVICEGELGYLRDTVQMYHHYENTLTNGFFEAILNYHNSIVGAVNPERLFSATEGVCTINNDNSKTTSYRSTLEEISENVISRLGGFLRHRRNADGLNIVDYYGENGDGVDGYGYVSTATVELAKNMKSMSIGSDMSGTITRLYPLGAQINDDTGERLTIESVNNGLPYIDDEEAIARTGLIKCGTIEFDDVTVAENLLAKGRQYLEQASRIRKSYKATVLDLSTIGKEAEKFEAGNFYKFYNPLVGLVGDNGDGELLRITKKTTDIYAPYQPTIEIGDRAEKISSYGAKARKYVEFEAPKQYSSILKQAKNNASALINNATKGYIYMDNEVGEFLIMDADNKEDAMKVWRWNSSGFGYSSNGYNGDYGLGMMKDGSIVADCITTGTMYADRINGGTLTIGGYDNQNGIVQVKDGSGNVICQFDNTGADIHGTVTATNNRGYWVKLEDGQFKGGIGSDSYGFIDGSATLKFGDVDYHGINIESPGGVVTINASKGFAVNNAIGQTRSLTYVTGGTITPQVEWENITAVTGVTRIVTDENGNVTDADYNKITFQLPKSIANKAEFDTTTETFTAGILTSR